jgi:hypothetical protein
MTNEKLLDLLREAQECVEEAAEAFDHLDAKTNDVLRRIDAALAERAEGSTEDVVQSDPVDWGAPDRFQIAHVGLFVAEVFPDRDGKRWVWAIAQRDNANTEAEAKSAAIAAARGVK